MTLLQAEEAAASAQATYNAAVQEVATITAALATNTAAMSPAETAVMQAKALYDAALAELSVASAAAEP